ncbi:GlsB/YeaQ/YmgE family stress response membrane protein [Ferrimonas balearica]|uniref:GlsB/YeaQ/YmgE family stress response membrane protein n=1 Tax=Ferrimonas balearica TaxID=44012 RepID=UPI001C992611|nr:GlsB/YeaQ/YmgE family stress response membrane protein [Ferrimonas balearica]MBY5993040.1 GlsB/YeaQ/YmgE family stress response membrane protein [Ferrimonas balearica]
MGFISWIILGLIVGVLAKWIMPGNDGGGIVMTILLGIGGAFVGGYIGQILGWGGVSGFDLGSLALAVLGALLVLFIYNKLRS